MTENKGKIGNIAEKAGETVGKGVKFGRNVVKGFGKGLKEGMKGKEEATSEQEEESS
ncbi:MAG: hypothetical protein GX307_03785 [Euryarchaeota archaeon]|mgnify:CR=1 FL=1|nr:hypothetical protein [Euryarchaeota archaeon]